MRLLVRFGEHCQALLDQDMQGLHSRLIQPDEIWTFVDKKEARLILEENGGEVSETSMC